MQNGQASSGDVGALRLTLEAFRQGQAGVEFDHLTRLSEPLLTFYQLDLKPYFHAPVSRDNQQEMGLLVDILSTTYRFWHYCRLPQEERQRSLPALQEDLLGGDASEDDRTLFPQLVEAVEACWDRMCLELDIAAAAALPPSTLQAWPEPGHPGSDYPPGDADAFALFARPLFEAADLMADPDLIEHLTQRAELYWDLAQEPADARESKINQFISQSACDASEADALRQEATEMMNRFDELFQDP